MGFSNWIFLWTAVMPFSVILYYFFRKKYKDQTVSSTLFWQEMMRELHASPYLKKLQHHLLFYLQLAALLLCMTALLGPFIHSDSLEGNELIFVVDTSATMLAGTPSHFERQQAKMRELAVQADGKPVTIITTGTTPEVIIRKERDSERVSEAVGNLEIAYENAEMEKTLLFAETLAEDESAVIHIFTDSLDRKVLANKVGHAYSVHGIDEKIQNLSIRQFGLAEMENDMRAIVQVVNDGSEPMSGTIELRGGENVESATVELEAGEELLVPFEELPEADLWQAALRMDDDYAADNEVYAFVRQPAASVKMDSSLHTLVSSGFEASGIRVESVGAGELNRNPDSPVVTNHSALLLEEVPVLLIGRDDVESFPVAGNVEADAHPLFTYAPLEEVYIAELYPPFDGFETIASIDEKPLIQLSPEGDIIVLTDIQSTDWPLSPSFPLFLWSAAGQLTGSGDYLGTFLPKEQKSIALTSDTGEWEIFNGTEYLHSYIEGSPFIAPGKPGIYRAVGDEETKTFIVQLSNEEKELSPGASYEMGEAIVSEETVTRSLVPWLILLVLLLILVEWEVYRRGTARR